MRGKERFKRMREVEKRIEPLVRKGWHVERVAYEDEEGEPFRAQVNLRLDDSDPKDGIC